ncbi:MAG: hypothetical protein WKF37_25290, partial [Bryobacteraceae bacterium]
MSQDAGQRIDLNLNTRQEYSVSNNQQGLRGRMRYRMNNGHAQNGTYDCVVNVRNGRLIRLSYDPPVGNYADSGSYNDRRNQRLGRNPDVYRDRDVDRDRNVYRDRDVYDDRGLGMNSGLSTASRRATMRSGDEGKCTIEVEVDGTAEVEVSGDMGLLRTLEGQASTWRRFECSAPLPRNANDFRFKGIDGRGRVELVQDPTGNRGRAVVRIEDSKGGREGYTFDLLWDRR